MSGTPAGRLDARREPRLSVALDATPLLGVQTGVGVFCREAMAAMALKPSLDVTAFAISWRRRHMLEGKVPPGARIVGRAMPARPLHLSWRHTGFPDLSYFVDRTDVVHGTNFVVPPARRSARVVTVHDMTTVRYPEMCENATLRFPGLVRRAVAEGAWVHTPSKYVADEVIAEFDVDPERVRAVHHGAPPIRASYRRKPPASLGVTGRYVLSIGTAEPRKDLPGLVTAFDEIAESVPDVSLVLAGQAGWGSRAVDSAIASMKKTARDRVVRPGYVDDLDALVAGASLLAYPSLYEGFGLPPLEAMSAGVPVVTTTAGALVEVVGDAALTVEPRDTAAFAEAMLGVLTDAALHAALVTRGRERAAMFTWEKCADGLESLYAEAVKSPR